MPIVREGGHSHLMSATNTLWVQSVTGLEILTAVVQFVMRWFQNLSVVRTLTVRILALMTTAVMLTAPQALTVSILTFAHDPLFLYCQTFDCSCTIHVG